MKNKGTIMPKEHFERNIDDLVGGDVKYASKSTMGNPEDLKKSADALAGYVKTNKMKY